MKTVKTKGFRVSQDFRDRQQLVRVGPVIKAEWRVHPEIESQLKSRGLAIPTPIHGYMLIDTGAAEIGIDGDVAKELNLTPIGKQDVHGVGGASSHDIYKALLLLYVGDVHGENVAIGVPRDFISFPKLREHHDAYGLKTPQGAPLRIIGILGRDFLQFTTLAYNGYEGSWDMQIDESVLRPYNPSAA